MLDVIHVFYEEDITPRHEKDIEVKDALRGQLYPLLYNRPYNYASSKQSGRHMNEMSDDLSTIPPLPEIPVESRSTPKPYIPPTPMEDLPGILDAPLR